MNKQDSEELVWPNLLEPELREEGRADADETVPEVDGEKGTEGDLRVNEGTGLWSVRGIHQRTGQDAS